MCRAVKPALFNSCISDENDSSSRFFWSIVRRCFNISIEDEFLAA